MKTSVWSVLLALQLLLSLASATSRNIAPTDSGTRQESLQPLSEGSMTRSMNRVATKMGAVLEEPIFGKQGGLVATMKIGSSPPSCEHKCSGCTPCQPAQVPATSTGHGHMRVQYTNYEPEGWKCKCGPSFYSP
ncbi:EPIDERMAL PATTERNING FACTOR-like protein 1 [Punica granatum]|uniref:Epidermal patterning factor-like protein n=2 Tax=Punica granatum TaxID=22663 RepID=A0A218X674_PUNGR|nr:EPIDERMAL PATTERNING FACTOR-like protein 1 [Punica granatum]OWM79872.1 hypothetical protein CDL15_Pgr001515 [Punica granatum]PKI58346.1 hypothetical protein CRG98_021284 [Punica granatum]